VSAGDGSQGIAGGGGTRGHVGDAGAGRALRGPRLTPVRAVLAAGLLGLAVVGMVLLLKSAPRRSDTNAAFDGGLAVTLRAGQQLCQPGEVVPADTAAIRLDAGASGAPTGPALAAELQNDPGVQARGTRAAGWRRGLVTVPLVPKVRADTVASVCVRNLGPGAAAFGGAVPAGSWVLSIDGRGLGGRVRIDYMRPGSESWFSLLWTLAHRITIGKSRLVRHWAPAAALLLMLIGVGVAVRTLLVSERRA
jgi:hypothetical protein